VIETAVGGVARQTGAAAEWWQAMTSVAAVAGKGNSKLKNVFFILDCT
jgi:hypothetical protein